MLTEAVIRQYAVGQHIDTEVADQEIVLHYALALLNEAGLTGRKGSSPGPLLFKGGTALQVHLRKHGTLLPGHRFRRRRAERVRSRS
jgi:hypothetical protein